jgi:endonuclease/exonuclease/phosphatase family metal-dependent hydrolase
MTINREQIYARENDYVMWCGDFNCHHPMWDEDSDERLFTAKAIQDADILINLLADWNMAMALPKGLPTLKHMVSKRYSRPDNVFSTDNLADSVIVCNTVPQLQPTKTDHFPIKIELSICNLSIIYPCSPPLHQQVPTFPPSLHLMPSQPSA